MSENSFYMVFLENERTPSYKHSTLDSAETEAKRLSELHKKKAYVLCTIKSYEIIKFKETDLRPYGDLPF